MSKSYSTSFSSPNLMKSVPKVCRMWKKKTNKQANKQKFWRSFQLNDSMTSDWILAIPQFYSHWVLVVSLGGHLSKGMTHLCLSYEYPGSNHLNVASWSSSKWKLVLFAPPKKAPKVAVIDASWLMNCCQKKVCWKKCVLGDVSRCENVQNKYMFSRWSCCKFARKKKDPEINEEWSGSIVFKNNVYSQRRFQPWLFARKRTSYSVYQFFCSSIVSGVGTTFKLIFALSLRSEKVVLEVSQWSKSRASVMGIIQSLTSTLPLFINFLGGTALIPKRNISQQQILPKSLGLNQVSERNSWE